jgi:acetyltransferase-like isoleucine patch superfamily enzyme
LTRCTIGAFSTVSNGATVLGDVTIGESVTVGGNAVVKNLLSVGDGAVIGCGANVIRDVESRTAVAGNPARTLGRLP